MTCSRAWPIDPEAEHSRHERPVAKHTPTWHTPFTLDTFFPPKNYIFHPSKTLRTRAIPIPPFRVLLSTLHSAPYSHALSRPCSRVKTFRGTFRHTTSSNVWRLYPVKSGRPALQHPLARCPSALARQIHEQCRTAVGVQHQRLPRAPPRGLAPLTGPQASGDAKRHIETRHVCAAASQTPVSPASTGSMKARTAPSSSGRARHTRPSSAAI